VINIQADDRTFPSFAKTKRRAENENELAFLVVIIAISYRDPLVLLNPTLDSELSNGDQSTLQYLHMIPVMPVDGNIDPICN
jgi:hypothetical protein